MTMRCSLYPHRRCRRMEVAVPGLALSDWHRRLPWLQIRSHRGVMIGGARSCSVHGDVWFVAVRLQLPAQRRYSREPASSASAEGTARHRRVFCQRPDPGEDVGVAAMLRARSGADQHGGHPRQEPARRRRADAARCGGCILDVAIAACRRLVDGSHASGAARAVGESVQRRTDVTEQRLVSGASLDSPCDRLLQEAILNHNSRRLLWQRILAYPLAGMISCR